MTNTNFHPDMNDNNDNGTIQSTDAAASEIVAEVPYDTAVPTMNQQIDALIVFDDNQHNVTVGQSENSPANRQRFVNIRRRPKTVSCIATAIVLLIFVLCCVRLVPPLDTEDTPVHDALMYVTLDDNQQGLTTKEEDNHFCANGIEENELDVNINNEINAPITYTSKRSHLKETPVIDVVDSSTYNSLDTYEKTDVSKIEPNGAVSTEDVRPTNLYIPKETSLINSNEEIVEKNTA